MYIQNLDQIEKETKKQNKKSIVKNLKIKVAESTDLQKKKT